MQHSVSSHFTQQSRGMQDLNISRTFVIMSLENHNILKEIESIKARLIAIEMHIIKSEKASKEDKKAVREALREYKKGKTARFV